MAIKLGIDMGMSGLKLVGAAGQVQFLSQAALIGNMSVDAPSLGRKKKRPLVIRSDKSGELFVGQGAHKWGMPLENFDYSRLAGVTSEMRAIFYGALTEYQHKFGKFEEPVEVVLGLPIQMMTGANKDEYEKQVKGWVGGGHTWQANGEGHEVIISRVGLIPQATGAVIDHALDMNGQAVSAENNRALTQECATVWIGSNTVELQVTKRDDDTKRYNGGAPIGVKWLHNQVDPDGLWKFGEFDEMLRANDLPDGMDIKPLLGPWATTIIGFTKDKWREGFQRFYRVFVGGGGSLLLKDEMRAHFRDKVVFPSDPIFSIARGLYKASLRGK